MLQELDGQEDDCAVENRREIFSNRDPEDHIRIKFCHGDAYDPLREFVDGGDHDELEDDKEDEEAVYVETRDFPIPESEDLEITHVSFRLIQNDTGHHRDDDDIKGDADVEEHVEYNAETIEEVSGVIGDALLVEFGDEIVFGESKFFVREIGVEKIRVFTHDLVEIRSRRKDLECGVLGEDVLDLEANFLLSEGLSDSEFIADVIRKTLGESV
mgnify:CR=1 FL=1